MLSMYVMDIRKLLQKTYENVELSLKNIYNA